MTVTDSGCTNIPLVGADVELTSTFVPFSGGHAHIDEEREGTGKFFMGDSEIGKTVEGLITDEEGKIPEFTYKAGIVGLKETINAEVMFKEEMVTGEALLEIKIRNLISLDPSEDYILLQSPTGVKNHPLNNFGRKDVVNKRIPVFAKQFRKDRTKATAQTGVLSINDLSLPFGGVFDLCGNLTECPGKGHGSHEIGIDVDINSVDSNDVSILNELDLLIPHARKENCQFIHAIHLRCF